LEVIMGGLDTGPALILFAVSFAGSFITVTMGLGGGVLVLATMASLLPPAALIPLHGVVQLGSNAIRAAVLIRHTFWTPVAGFALGAIIGATAGGQVAVALPAGLLKLVVGVFVLWTLLSRPPPWLARWPWLSGAISTLLTMFVGATGPFVATMVRAFGLPRQSHVATHAVLMTLQHGLKIAVFGLLGFAFAPWLGFLVAMIACGAVGTLLGKRVLLSMNDRLFRIALNLVLALLAIRLIVTGLVSL
jgi:uncharacterized membrane protein YfcA